MKYYTINWDDNLKNVGYHPQTELNKRVNTDFRYNHYDVEYNKFPNFIPNLELELHNKAKVTDYLNVFAISFGNVISKSFYDILKRLNLPSCNFYPIKVYHKGKLLEYYWFHYIIEDFWKYLDKNKTKGIIYDDKDEYKVVSEIDLNYSPQEISIIDENLPWHQHMKWEKIVFKPDFPKYDVYETQTLEYRTVISERLLNALQEAGMTGFTTKLYDKIVCE